MGQGFSRGRQSRRRGEGGRGLPPPPGSCHRRHWAHQGSRSEAGQVPARPRATRLTWARSLAPNGRSPTSRRGSWALGPARGRPPPSPPPPPRRAPRGTPWRRPSPVRWPPSPPSRHQHWRSGAAQAPRLSANLASARTRQPARSRGGAGLGSPRPPIGAWRGGKGSSVTNQSARRALPAAGNEPIEEGKGRGWRLWQPANRNGAGRSGRQPIEEGEDCGWRGGARHWKQCARSAGAGPSGHSFKAQQPRLARALVGVRSGARPPAQGRGPLAGLP